MAVKKHWAATIVIWGLTAVASAQQPLPAPPLPNILSAKVFRITDPPYNAQGNGTTDNTNAIQGAINDAANYVDSAGNKGGTVEIPVIAGTANVYQSSFIHPTSNMNLQIDSGATLQALPFGKYPGSGTVPNDVPSFIYCSNLSNFEITGGGTIDGNGGPWWADYAANPTHSRPILVDIQNCDTVLVRGVTLINSPKFNLNTFGASNVTVDGITVTAPGDWTKTDVSENSPNTDAIDVGGHDFLIQNCTLSTGDDDVAMGAKDTPTSRITIRNCTINQGHGISIGSYTNFGISSCYVDHLTFTGTLFGIRFKTAGDRGGGTAQPTHDIHYSNLQMSGVNYPIIFYDAYVNTNAPYPTTGIVPLATDPRGVPAPITTTTPSLSGNITIRNLLATNPPFTGQAGLIWGLPESAINDVKLQNVKITAPTGFVIDHVRSVSFDSDCHLTITSGENFVGAQPSAGTTPIRPVDVQVVSQGYTNAQINSPALPINASSISFQSLFDPDTDIWQMDNMGSGIGGTSDQFAYSWLQTSNVPYAPAHYIAQVLSISNPDGSTVPQSQAGIMFRASTQPGDPFIALVQTTKNQIILEWRADAGGAVSQQTAPGTFNIGSIYLQISDTTGPGNYVASYCSDGHSWIPLGTMVQIPNLAGRLAQTVGLVVGADNSGNVAEAKFGNVGLWPVVLPPPHNWIWQWVPWWITVIVVSIIAVVLTFAIANLIRSQSTSRSGP